MSYERIGPITWLKAMRLTSTSYAPPPAFFADQPIAVIHEDLLPYVAHGQRAALAGNMHALLERFGGVVFVMTLKP